MFHTLTEKSLRLSLGEERAMTLLASIMISQLSTFYESLTSLIVELKTCRKKGLSISWLSI